MLSLKSVYFYLIALQITFIKFLKRIYFSSNHYNKSLITKAPQQTHYNPNPFLLSIVTDYRKDSFKISEVDPSMYSRLLQANFESTLDARYAISNGYIWSVFIHPLESLNEDLLDSGYLQTLTAAQTFGTSYTSGVASFGKGSDPAAAEFAMLQELKRTNRLM